MPTALYHTDTRERNTGAPTAPPPVNYGPRNLPPKELAAVVYHEQPVSGVWIDLAGKKVELARPDRAPLAFYFDNGPIPSAPAWPVSSHAGRRLVSLATLLVRPSLRRQRPPRPAAHERRQAARGRTAAPRHALEPVERPRDCTAMRCIAAFRR